MNAIDTLIGALERDIGDRRGLKREWEKIESDVKNEIRSAWRKLIFDFLVEKHLPTTDDTVARGHVVAVNMGDLSKLTRPSDKIQFTATVQFGYEQAVFGLTEEQFRRVRERIRDLKNVRARLVIDTETGEVNDRDNEWCKALSEEFKIGGAIMTHDDQWVREKTTIPERWARLVRLAITPRDVKLHDYKLHEHRLDLSIVDLSKPEK